MGWCVVQISPPMNRLRIHRHSVDPHAGLLRDVRAGLGGAVKTLPPKYFYDAVGSDLFEQITELPEYYQTRTELQILLRDASRIIDHHRPTELVELGSGSSRKTVALLDAMADAGLLRRFIPFDVSSSAIADAAERLCDRFPELQVEGVLGDFDHHIPTIPPRGTDGRRMVIFLGGTIGNFHPDDRAPFLRDLRGLLRSGDSLLAGIDLVKDPAVLEAAYNDGAGVTAAFNRNVLHVMNRELGSDFVPERFTHVAIYDRENAWIEMRLRSDVAQRVTVPALDMVVDFAVGEEMRTEISAKFTPQRFADELSAAGLADTEFFTDDDRRFAVAVAEVA